MPIAMPLECPSWLGLCFVALGRPLGHHNRRDLQPGDAIKSEMKTPTTIYPSTNLPTRTWRNMRLVFRRLQDDGAKLFSRLWKSPPKCIHNKTTAIRSELGHDAVRRYYWVCSKCGERVYTTIGQETPTVFPEHPGAELSQCNRGGPRSSRK